LDTLGPSSSSNQGKKNSVRDALSQFMHKIGRINFARYFFLPNSARNGISVCSRNDLKISDFYLNSLLEVLGKVEKDEL